MATADGAAGAADAERWRVEELVRIGAIDGEGPDVFGKVVALEVDAEGNLAAFDEAAQELRVFSRDGEHRLTFGRPGEGPGEFGRVVGLVAIPGGGIRVVDSRPARHTVVELDGSFTTFPRHARSANRAWLGGYSLDGSLYEFGIEQEWMDPHVDYLMLQLGPEGEEIGRFSVPKIDVPALDLGGGGVTVPVPYAPQGLRAWDPRGGVWQAMS